MNTDREAQPRANENAIAKANAPPFVQRQSRASDGATQRVLITNQCVFSSLA